MEKIKDLNMRTNEFSSLMFSKVAEIYVREKKVFSTNYTGKTGYPHADNEIRPLYVTLHKMNNYKWIKYLNVNLDTQGAMI